MQQFFEEFEDYVRRTYGERHFFRNLLEDSVRPLYDSLESLSSEDILESIFGEIDTDNIQRALDELANNLPTGASSTPTSPVLSTPSNTNGINRESGLSQGPIEVNIVGIDDKILKSLSGKGGSGIASSVGGGVGKAAMGIGAGLGFLGISSLLGSGGLGAGTGKAIKTQVETLLSIGDEYNPLELGARMLRITTVLSALGIGLTIFTAGKGVNALVKNDGWTDTLNEEINKLLIIGDQYNPLELGARMLRVTTVLGSLGLGLAAFAAGKGINSMLSFNKGWANDIKSDVETLLSIGTGIPDNKKLGNGEFMKMMGSVALGLAAFSLGKGVQGLNGLMTDVIEGFTGQNFASSIKEEVETLLSIGTGIPDNKKLGNGEFIKMMGSVALGLAAFSLGKGMAGASDLLPSIIEKFTKENFAENIKGEVETLLSIGIGIPANERLSNGEFVKMMGSIGAGLVAFSVGKGGVTISEFVDIISQNVGGRPFTTAITEDVGMLLSLGDNADLSKAGNFKNIMATIAAGLVTITTSDFVGALGGVGTKIVTFFTGKESPMESLLKLAENGDKLMTGAKAIALIGSSLKSFGEAVSTTKFDTFNFEEMAKNLGQAVPFLDVIARGGTYDYPGWGKFKLENGLLSKEFELDKLVSAVGRVNNMLSGKSDPTLIKSNNKSDSEEIKNKDEQRRKEREEDKKELKTMLEELGLQINQGTLIGADYIVGAVAQTAGSGGQTNVTNISQTFEGDSIRSQRNQSKQALAK